MHTFQKYLFLDGSKINLQPGIRDYTFLAFYNLVKNLKIKYNPFTGGEITPFDIYHSNPSSIITVIGEILLIRPRHFWPGAYS